MLDTLNIIDATATKLIQAAAALLFLVSAAGAQCMSTSAPSCQIYRKCFEDACKCETSSTPYFISFGERYCKKFLGETGWSTQGEKWRDSTLVCLQEKLAPLVIEGPPCDCKSLRNAAFSVHVACYTKSEASICDLPFVDWVTIGKIIDSKDLFFDPEGRQQARSVFNICVSKLTDGPVKSKIKELLGKLAL